MVLEDPGIVVGISVIVSAICTLLGVWQVQKNVAKKDMLSMANDQIENQSKRIDAQFTEIGVLRGQYDTIWKQLVTEREIWQKDKDLLRAEIIELKAENKKLRVELDAMKVHQC
jgi:hypothetical protein